MCICGDLLGQSPFFSTAPTFHSPLPSTLSHSPTDESRESVVSQRSPEGMAAPRDWLTKVVTQEGLRSWRQAPSASHWLGDVWSGCWITATDAQCPHCLGPVGNHDSGWSSCVPSLLLGHMSGAWHQLGVGDMGSPVRIKPLFRTSLLILNPSDNFSLHPSFRKETERLLEMV